MPVCTLGKANRHLGGPKTINRAFLVKENTNINLQKTDPSSQTESRIQAFLSRPLQGMVFLKVDISFSTAVLERVYLGRLGLLDQWSKDP
jgi:hypothetical protein